MRYRHPLLFTTSESIAVRLGTLRALIAGLAGLAISNLAVAEVRLPVSLYDDPVQQIDPWKYTTNLQSAVWHPAIHGIDTFEHADILLAVDALKGEMTPVGRFEIKRLFKDTNTYGADFCTAWLVAPSIALTNHHCVAGDDVNNDRFSEGRVRFGSYGEGVQGKIFRVEAILEDNDTYDFALLKLAGRPGDEFGYVKLDVREAMDSEPLILFGYPNAYPLMVTRANCYSLKPAIVAEDVHHHCDTLGGSSGSIVYAQKDGRVVALHYAAGDGTAFNAAKDIVTIIDHSPTLMHLAAGERPQIPIPPQAEVAQMSADDAIRAGLAAEARKDYQAARLAFQAAAGQGSTIAAGYIARVYAEGRDYDSAMEWYRRAADQDDPRGYAGVGYLFDYGLGRASDVAQAVQWYKKAVARDFAPAEYFLGRVYEPGSDRPSPAGAAKNAEDAISLFKRASDQGYPLASYELGRVYVEGAMVPRDLPQGVQYLVKAQKAGVSDAKAWLARHQ